MADHKVIVNFITAWEGGVSSAQTDNARKDPAPCGNGKNGYPIHTNKGVTWTAFKEIAPKVGIPVTCEAFMKMDQSMWLKIYKYGYWDKIQGDAISNQAVANMFAEWAWMSGTGGAKKSMAKFLKQNYGITADTIDSQVKALNELSAKNPTELFNKLVKHREDFFKNLNQPSNLKGWLNRLSDFAEKNVQYIHSKTIAINQFAAKHQDQILTAALVVGVGTALAFIVDRLSSRQSRI